MLPAFHASPRRRTCLVLASLLFAAMAAQAQPSGGPYGPVDQNYRVPKAAHVYYVAPDGDAQASGRTLKQPTTIEAAIARAVTGDAIVMRGGVYRTGGLVLNQGIVIQPYAGERPILKGTEVATNWENMGGNVWRTNWTKFFPAAPLGWWNRAREEARTPLHRFNNDMVFIDGEFLKSAGGVNELDAHSYYIDYQNHYVYIGTDPAKRLVEITAHDGALIVTSRPVHGKVSNHKGPAIRGLTVTQYARRCLEVEGKKQFGPNDEPTDEPVGLSDPGTFGKEVVGTVFENMTITYCSRVAGWFRGDRLVIRNSLVSDTSTEGIYVIGSADVLLERNIVRRNNIEQLTGYYPSAVKIFNQTRRVTFRDNLVLDNPNSNGVWYDVGNRDGVFVNNYVEGALVGFFFEISRGVTVAGNVLVRNGRGIWILNSADARVYNNTFVDNPATFSRNERVPAGDLFDWHSATGPGLDKRDGHVFVNNLIVAGETFRDPLMRVDQSPALCGKLVRPQLARIDGNVYVRASVQGTNAAPPLIAWAPAGTPDCGATAVSLADFRRMVPRHEIKGRQIDTTLRSVFRGPDIDRYELRTPVAGAVALPVEIRKLLGWGKLRAVPAGAYPFRR
jgi:parallel beta-helix repeat protein